MIGTVTSHHRVGSRRLVPQKMLWLVREQGGSVKQAHWNSQQQSQVNAKREEMDKVDVKTLAKRRARAKNLNFG